jgi:hypothetical protein
MSFQFLLRLAAVPYVCLTLGLIAEAQTCSEAIAQSSGSHRFRRVGETIEIPIAPVEGSSETQAEQDSPATECYPIALELSWINGRNQGAVFRVLFLDTRNQPIFGREISAFMVGNVEFPIGGGGAGKGFGRTMVSLPAKITIQTKEPFGSPANVNYSVVWVENRRKGQPQISVNAPGAGDVVSTPVKNPGNEVTRIRNVSRLIGSSRLPLVQIELKAAQPFPVRDTPLQMRIGKRVFLNELSGDYTGRLLTLSLTPAMFAELEDGAEIVTFFDERESWSFGKLQKSSLK